MNYNQVEKYLSTERLNRYLRASNNCKSKAMDLYRINLSLSQAFYPMLNLFEIILRNVISTHIARHFEDNDWIVNQKNHFMSHPSLRGTKYFLRTEVERVERVILKRSNTITSAKVIAEQNFGFWTSLFDPHHFRLIGGVTIHSFQHKPSNTNRKSIALMLKDIREFRNRVYHNEPICFKANEVNFSKAIQIREKINKITSWIDPQLLNNIQSYDNILQNIP